MLILLVFCYYCWFFVITDFKNYYHMFLLLNLKLLLLLLTFRLFMRTIVFVNCYAVLWGCDVFIEVVALLLRLLRCY